MPNQRHEWRRRRASPVGVDRITVSFRPAIPRRVAPQQSPLPLRRPRQCTSLDHSGTIDAGQPVLIFLSHQWGAVQAGRLIIGNNSALGTGTFTIAGGTVRSTAGSNISVGNPVAIPGNFQAGEAIAG